MILDAKAAFDEDTRRPGGMTSANLISAQTRAQSVINQRQGIQDLQGANFSLTTQNGDILEYVGDTLSRVQRPDGTTLNHIQLGADGSITSADLALSDGSIQIFQNGRALAVQTPDGVQVFYNENGRIDHTVSRDEWTPVRTESDPGGRLRREYLSGGASIYHVYQGESIQAAVDQSNSGDTLLIHNGVYHEHLTLKEGVSLKGESAAGAVITGDALLGSDVIEAQGRNTIENLTLTGGGAYSGFPASAIKVTGGDVSIRNNRIQGNLDYGIFVFWAQGRVLIEKNLFVDNHLAVQLPQDGAVIQYNTFVNNDIAVNILGGESPEVAHNIIVGSRFQSIYEYAGGQAPQARVHDNVLFQNAEQSRPAAQNLPPAVANQTNGNLVRDPLFVNAALGDYSVLADSPAYEKGAFLPEALSRYLDRRAGPRQTGVETFYTYRMDSGGGLFETALDNLFYTTTYDADNRLKELYDKVTGARTYYHSGIIQRTVESSGAEILYDGVVQANGDTLVTPRVAGASDYLSITYGPDLTITQVIARDNSRIIFQNGLLSQALDPSGHPANFNFSQSPLSNITGSEIVQNGLDSQYDSTGRLSQVRIGDLTIHYGSTPPAAGGTSSIDYIEKTDGTRLQGLAFGADGRITGAEVTAPDGEIRTYRDGRLVNLARPDGSEILYRDDRPLRFITPENTAYNFDYTVPGIVQANLDSALIPQASSLTPIQMQYDAGFNLTRVIRRNNEALSYLNNSLIRIDPPSGDPQVFNYQTDADGHALSYTVTQGNVETFYDADNQPLRAVIRPRPATQDSLLEVIYQYGRIRQIQKDGVAAFRYSYTFDSDNEELTHIDELDPADPAKVKVQKVYKGGSLLTSLDTDTAVLSTYSYSTDGKVSQVQVTRLGRPLHTYDYTYSGDLTIVIDEERVQRAYGADKKLLYLEKDSQKFQYSYHQNQGGEEIAGEDLIQKTLSDGSVVHYAGGQVSRIDLPDGSFITEVALNADRSLQRATINLSDGARRVFNGRTILEEIDPDNTHFYFENNVLSRVTRPGTEDLLFSYDKDADGHITAFWVKRGLTSFQYDAGGNLLGVKFDSILDPEDIHAQTTRSYYGGSNGPYSADGNFSSAQVGSASCSGCGGSGTSLFSTHAFGSQQTVASVTFRIKFWSGLAIPRLPGEDFQFDNSWRIVR